MANLKALPTATRAGMPKTRKHPANEEPGEDASSWLEYAERIEQDFLTGVKALEEAAIDVQRGLQNSTDISLGHRSRYARVQRRAMDKAASGAQVAADSLKAFRLSWLRNIGDPSEGNKRKGIKTHQ